MTELVTPAVPASPPEDLTARLEGHRAELTGHCYRMLGSSFEAEDAVQETFIRAWRAYDRFEGRAAFRSWLYRIATNVCLDMLTSRQRRARPVDLSAARSADNPLGTALPETAWIEPMPDERAVPAGGDPAEVAIARESIRLAFVAALQHLPPRQRAVLILREVLRWHADEVAELLDTTVASVNSALQRARATLAERKLSEPTPQTLDEQQRSLLGPPYELWLQTHEDVVKWCLGPGIGCQGSRLVATWANGSPAFGQYKPDPNGGHAAWSLQVLELDGDRISGITFFLDTARFFPLFGLPLRLED
jgi:RNA polymerase sigma-70 factor (ECF subfamily)